MTTQYLDHSKLLAIPGNNEFRDQLDECAGKLNWIETLGRFMVVTVDNDEQDDLGQSDLSPFRIHLIYLLHRLLLNNVEIYRITDCPGTWDWHRKAKTNYRQNMARRSERLIRGSSCTRAPSGEAQEASNQVLEVVRRTV